MNAKIQRTAGYLLIAPLLAMLLFTGVVERAEAAREIDSPEAKSPIAMPAPFSTAIPGSVPRWNGGTTYALTPPALNDQTIPATELARPSAPQLPAEAWKDWPVLPFEVSAEMRALYQGGLRKGTNPGAFSVIGDCQSQPEVFMGMYDTEPRSLRLLPANLRDTARNFTGSFGRVSPTVRDGITAGAVLWNEWAKNYQGGRVCQPGESPLTCELRINKPSIVFIHIGTHWESRNERYLTLIIETIKEHGAVPVMVTKADNREKDERINLQSVRVAQEQGIPVWNFWASVQGTPNGGLEDGSDMYLNEQAMEIHRISALQVLDLIWRGAK
jgi:hypothetical protein